MRHVVAVVSLVVLTASCSKTVNVIGGVSSSDQPQLRHVLANKDLAVGGGGKFPNLNQPYTPGMPHGVFESAKFGVFSRNGERWHSPAEIPTPRGLSTPKFSLMSLTDYSKLGNWIRNWTDTTSSYPASGAYAKHRISDTLTNPLGNGDLYTPTLAPAKRPGLEVLTYYSNVGPAINVFNHSSNVATWDGTNPYLPSGSIASHAFGGIPYTTNFKNTYTHVDGAGVRWYWVTLSRPAGSPIWFLYIWNTAVGRWDSVASVSGIGTIVSHDDGWDMHEHNNMGTGCVSYSGTNRMDSADLQVYGRNPTTGVSTWYNNTISDANTPWVPGTGRTLIDNSGLGSCYDYHLTTTNYNDWVMN